MVFTREKTLGDFIYPQTALGSMVKNYGSIKLTPTSAAMAVYYL